MQETEYRRVVDAAKERALFGFLALIQRAMQDADKNLVQTLSGASSGLNQSALAAVRHFLRQDGNVFLRRVDSLYRTSLERAMQTMYVDMRPDMRKLTADELTLIDDEVVNHQIEVGRLAARMREACEESVGRLNVIVAHLHGESEARERENPFRPYLLARALYDAIRGIADDEAKTKLLFEHLAEAVVQHLPGYYAAIREVFESSGLRGRFQAMPSRAGRYQRYFGAVPADLPSLSSRAEEQLAPGLQRILQAIGTLPGNPGGAAVEDAEPAQPPSVQELIRSLLGASGRTGTTDGLSGAQREADQRSSRLIAQLDRFQREAARAAPADGETAENRLFEIRERLDLSEATAMDKATVEVVAMLFEFIVEDRQLPLAVRRQVARLQVPVLKAAMLDPGLLQDESHPARRLLNRIGSAAASADFASPAGEQLAARIERLASGILENFDTDVSVFADACDDFEEFLTAQLGQEDKQALQGMEAVETAEKLSVLLANTRSALVDLLLPLNVDKRISDVIIRIWPHVLAHAAWQDHDAQRAADHDDSLFRQCRAVLPDLIWSIQEKTLPAERNALIRMLPDLVKRMNKGFKLIQLPEEDSKEILDQLVTIHTQVLRGAQKGEPRQALTLEALHADFARLTINWERVTWRLTEPPQVRDDLLEEALVRHGLVAQLHLGERSTAASDADREFLQQTYLVGTRIALRDDAADGSDPAAAPTAQLAWISTHRSLYLFRREGDGALSVYTAAALLEALAQGAVVPVEYAPVFERAVESLLFGAEKFGL
jgi:hypothetical protein